MAFLIELFILQLLHFPLGVGGERWGWGQERSMELTKAQCLVAATPRYWTPSTCQVCFRTTLL